MMNNTEYSATLKTPLKLSLEYSLLTQESMTQIKYAMSTLTGVDRKKLKSRSLAFFTTQAMIITLDAISTNDVEKAIITRSA